MNGNSWIVKIVIIKVVVNVDYFSTNNYSQGYSYYSGSGS